MQTNIETKKYFRPAFSYDFLTPCYDILTDLTGFGKSLKRKVVKLLKLKGDEKVLDVGVGTGTLLIELNKSYPSLNLVGIDPDPKVLNIAKSKLAKYKVRASLSKAFAQDLPFPDASFDLVVSTLTFHHLPSQAKKKALEEIHRILRNGGKFLLADFGKPQGPVSYILLHLGSIFDGGEEMKANLRGELPIMLKDKGFIVDKIGNRYLGMEFLLARKDNL